MNQCLAEIAGRWLEVGAPFRRVVVAAVEGSTPREAGAQMLVGLGAVHGTIGGGRLEQDAIDRARAMIASGETARTERVPLGPAIGQCCGGRVTLAFSTPDAAEVAAMREAGRAAFAARPAVLLHGAGHVGRALARALAPLPFRTTLIDQRAEELARADAPGVALVHTAEPIRAAEEAPPGAAHVVATHSHALDGLIAGALLERGDFRYLGLIGSATKRALFLGAFRDMGLPADRIARVICPIGGTAVRDKRPEVIAALTAAEIASALLAER